MQNISSTNMNSSNTEPLAADRSRIAPHRNRRAERPVCLSSYSTAFRRREVGKASTRKGLRTIRASLARNPILRRFGVEEKPVRPSLALNNTREDIGRTGGCAVAHSIRTRQPPRLIRNHQSICTPPQNQAPGAGQYWWTRSCLLLFSQSKTNLIQ